MTTDNIEHSPSGAHAMALRDLLPLAAWFGLVTGLGEVALLGVAKFILHRIIHLGSDVVWMAPLADVLIFAIAAIVLALASRWWPRLVSLRVVVFTFAFLGFLSLLLMYQRLDQYAAVVFAAGLAAVASRFTVHHARHFNSFVRYSLGGLVIVVAGMALSLRGWAWLGEVHARSTLPDATRGAANVLLIVLDTVRAEHLSAYGYARPTTPNLERLAKSGVVFDRAISTAPWTLSSHASMFTGHFPHELSADWEAALDNTYPTLAEILAAHGYETAGFVANTDVCSYEFGLNRGFAHYEDYVVSFGEIVRSSSLARVITDKLWLRRLVGNFETLGRKTAARLNRDFLHWLSHREPRPFFAFLNYFDAHGPYLPPQPFDSKFGEGLPRSNPWLLPEWKWSAADIQAEVDAYDGSIAYLDHEVGRLIDELRKRGVLENTLVIVASDHGEEFGEHGLFSHGNSLYLPSLHVPLLISFPSSVPTARRIEVPVTLRDLPATVLELLAIPGKPQLPGSSLARYWNGNHDLEGPASSPVLSEVNFARNLPNWFPVSKGDMKALMTGELHYIKNGDGREELYDVERDPAEARDLVDSTVGRQAIETFRDSLGTILAAHHGRAEAGAARLGRVGN